ERSASATRPRSATSPVNIAGSPFLDPRRDEQVLADPLAVERHRPDRVRDRLDPFTLQWIASGPAAEHQRRQEQADLVDLAGVEKGAGQVRPALEEDRADLV